MDQQNQPLSTRPHFKAVSQAAILRAIWIVLSIMVVSLVLVAVPLRYQMLLNDVYGFGPALAEIGLSLRFFALYFTFWELVVITGSLIVAGVIAWRKADDPFAMLVAITLTMYGLLPPLVDGLALLNPLWQWLVIAFRVAEMVCLMAVFCLFPNGRFQPRWTRWLFVSWLAALAVAYLIKPDLLADTAVLPRTRSLADALFLLVGVGWFAFAIGGQIYRYARLASTEERQQTKWVLFGFVMSVLFSLISALLLISVPFLRENPQGRLLFTLSMGVLYLLSALLLPITIALAMLRYRLWEVDLFINRTLVYGGLTALVTAVYVLLVGGLGLLTAGESGSVAGVVMTTLLVAILIKPLQRSLQRGADRLVPTPTRKPAGKETAVSEQDGTLLHGRTRLAARLMWLGNLLLALTLLAVGTVVMLQQNLFQTITQGTFPVDIALVRVVQNGSDHLGPAIWIVPYVQFFAFVIVGLFLFWRKSKDRMGILASLMLIAIGIGFTANIIFLPFLLPGWHIPVTIFQGIMFGSVLLFLYWFPNGRFYPSWTKVASIAWILYTALWLLFPDLNPHRSSSIWPVAIWMACVWLGVIAQIWRYRRISEPAERQQTKWVVAGFVGANFGLFLLVLFSLLGGPTSQDGAAGPSSYSLIIMAGMGAILIPISMSIALFRYRLWEIDFIINRTLVFGGLTLLVLLIYALLVGALSSLFQTQNSLLISLLATGLIAVIFQPVRTWLQRGVNRLMFGERDDPYGVLSRLGRQLRETAVPGQTLPAITATITQTLKLPYAAIELATADGEREPAAVSGQATAVTEEWPLMYQGDTVGWLLVAPRTPGELFTSKERQLLEDIATQAGAAAYSVRLTTALQKSRERMVLAREEERRRIRSDLHDELGPSLASQTFKLDAALDLLEADPQAAADLLNALKTQNQDLVGDIRRLVYELRPPALDELGLMGALQAHTGQIDAPDMSLSAVPDPLPHLPAAVEVAAYRIALEATTNVIRHAQAQRCTVKLEADNSRLTLTISDDGRGLPKRQRSGVGLTSMRERAEELGGVLSVDSLAGGGVTVTSVLPI